MAEKWLLERAIFDACNYPSVPCPCAFFRDPTGSDCRTMAAFRIEKGSTGSTSRGGLHAAMVAYAAGNLMKRIDKAGFILDETASSAQGEALLNIFGGEAGGFFGVLSKLVKTDLGVKYAKLRYINDGKSWSVHAGKMFEAKGGIVKAPPGLGIETVPKRAETYDSFCGPLMEKIIGTSEYPSTGFDWMEFVSVIVILLRGRFKYKGQ